MCLKICFDLLVCVGIKKKTAWVKQSVDLLSQLKIVFLFKEVGDPNFLSRGIPVISVTKQSMEILVCYINLIQGLY